MSLKNLVGPIAIAPILALASSANASITYIGFESLGGATVNLSITTDGVVGTVSQSDITSWNISIADIGGMVDMTPANSQVYDSGSLSATASALSFKFASYLDLSGLVLFQMGTIGDFGPFWCATNADSAGPCYGETFPAIGVSTQQGDSPIEQLELVGETVIATVVPEPSTWAMLALGFGGLGFACYRSRKFSAAA